MQRKSELQLLCNLRANHQKRGSEKGDLDEDCQENSRTQQLVRNRITMRPNNASAHRGLRNNGACDDWSKSDLIHNGVRLNIVFDGF